ncbi:MAG TPA: ABC transporter ATP-binding protein [Candidatus Acidoferrum sp.]|nr:ABC transporter ATP-binding protein [Candidatus Acidoferrum sp.]
MHILDVNDVSFSYGDIGILNDISFYADNDEFISIIGPSGCGKSTLLRIIAGLIKPSGGDVLFMGKRVDRPEKGMAFVFQDFALMPWLTNLENVKLGLSVTDLPDSEKEKRALALLKMLGLDGFEESYPNVLSGGMKQRVGIARAMASNPKVLLMDEPFSSLDELTATTLRNEVIQLLKNGKSPISSVVMVSHNVEEAIELSDKVVVLSNKPAGVKRVLNIKMNRPRNRESKEFMKMVDGIYADLTE